MLEEFRIRFRCFFAIACLLFVQSHSFAQSISVFAGRWVSNASFISKMASNHVSDYDWTGQTWGYIEPTGHIQLVADNGCILDGRLTKSPLPGVMWVTGEVFVSSCVDIQMNRTYRASATIPRGKKHLVLSFDTATTDRTSFLPADKFYIKGTFAKY